MACDSEHAGIRGGKGVRSASPHQKARERVALHGSGRDAEQRGSSLIGQQDGVRLIGGDQGVGGVAGAVRYARCGQCRGRAALSWRWCAWPQPFCSQPKGENNGREQ
jgi:hypothetical protein